MAGPPVAVRGYRGLWIDGGADSGEDTGRTWQVRPVEGARSMDIFTALLFYILQLLLGNVLSGLLGALLGGAAA
jgi:hypothetical protein